jgi:hypothetical protein
MPPSMPRGRSAGRSTPPQLNTSSRGGRYSLARAVLLVVDWSDRDDVAQIMMDRPLLPELIAAVRVEAGASLLRTMRDELGSGWATSDEIAKASLLGAVLIRRRGGAGIMEPADRSGHQKQGCNRSRRAGWSV